METLRHPTCPLEPNTPLGFLDATDLKACHPSDVAEILERDPGNPRGIVQTLLQLPRPLGLEAFEQLSIETQQACLETGNTATMLQFIENLEPDDRVDLLKRMGEELREGLMPLIAQAERNDIRRLWDYREGTAGAVMTTEYAFLPEDIPARTALDRLRLQAPNKETIYYVYIIDAERRLRGMVSLRDLIMARPDASLGSIMETQVIAVNHDMDVEQVAAMISKYDFLALPVVDHHNRLLGIITVDDVIDIIESASTEDFHRISAVSPFEGQYFRRALPRLFWDRFGWLAVLLVTSVLSTSIMEWNAPVLQQMVALSFFIPMVIGTCGNAGTQSATMVVRALALGEVAPRDFPRVFRRELVMGLALGVALGVMACLRVFLQDHNVILGGIVGTALLATLLAANLAGALMPLALKAVRLDPALTAGPFIATLIDAVGIGIYFLAAAWMIRVFGGG